MVRPLHHRETQTTSGEATRAIVDAHNDLLLELAVRAHRGHERDPFGARGGYPTLAAALRLRLFRETLPEEGDP